MTCLSFVILQQCGFYTERQEEARPQITGADNHNDRLPWHKGEGPILFYRHLVVEEVYHTIRSPMMPKFKKKKTKKNRHRCDIVTFTFIVKVILFQNINMLEEQR